MQFLPSYIKDATEFINKLASAKTIPPDVLLVTMDVTSLNAYIPHVDGVVACSKFLMITVLPIFLPTFYVLSYNSY